MIRKLPPQFAEFLLCLVNLRQVKILVIIRFRCKEKTLKALQIASAVFRSRYRSSNCVQFFFRVRNSSFNDGLEEAVGFKMRVCLSVLLSVYV
jgi:hypothetical protein